MWVKSTVRDYFESAVIAVIFALFVRTFVVQAFKIPTGSMETNLLIGEHLLVIKFIYGMQIPGVDGRFLTIREPERGDIVLFEFPEDRGQSFWKKRDFIKRVIGLPGDTVEIRDKKVFVNGQPHVTPEAVYKEGTIIAGGRDNLPPVKVPAGHYSVLCWRLTSTGR